MEIVAWFLPQLTTQVFPFFEIPDSAIRFVGIALAVSFPIAMSLSWLYEFTLEGMFAPKILIRLRRDRHVARRAEFSILAFRDAPARDPDVDL